MIAIALLGAGYAGQIQLEAWLAIDRAQVVGVWDGAPERAQALSAEAGVEAFDDLDALLARPDVDAVDVATPLQTHVEYGLRAARAGKHVLCQKPLAPTLEEAGALVEGCARAGVRLMVNENWRWRPWYRAARGLVQEGALGEPFYLRVAARSAAAVATSERPPERFFGGRTFLRSMTPLILLELGVHYLDVVRFLLGDPNQVYARTLKVTPAEHVQGEEVASLLLAYPDRLAVVELSWASIGWGDGFQPDRMALEGTEGSLFLEQDGKLRLTLRGEDDRWVPLETSDYYRRSWEGAVRHFVDCLESGQEFETSGRQNLLTLRLALAGYESAASGQAVAV